MTLSEESVEEAAGQSPWVGCAKGDFSMCRVNPDSPPAARPQSTKPTRTQSLSASAT